MTTHAEPVRRSALLDSATRHSTSRCVALCLMSTASTGAGLLLPAALGRTLDLLLAHAAATRWVVYCAGIVLLPALLDACETVLGGTADARTAARLRRRLTGHVLAVGRAQPPASARANSSPVSSATRLRRGPLRPPAPHCSPRSPVLWGASWRSA